MDNKKLVPVVVAAIAIIAIGVWIWYGRGTSKKEPTGTVETAKEVSGAVPEIQTNPAQKVPEINPLDRANPFKYKNPLR